MDNQEQYLYPGGLIVSQEPIIVTTVLGSCVSLCLWDPVSEIGGINHYMLPYWNGSGLATPRYGNIAIEKLLERMLELGCKKENLIAKVFGGARVLQMKYTSMDIGQNNVIMVEKKLKEQELIISAKHVGGEKGRKIRFNTQNGIVMMKLLNKMSLSLENMAGVLK